MGSVSEHGGCHCFQLQMEHQFNLTEGVIIGQTLTCGSTWSSYLTTVKLKCSWCGVSMGCAFWKLITFFMQTSSYWLGHIWFNEVNLLDWIEFKNSSDSKKNSQLLWVGFASCFCLCVPQNTFLFSINSHLMAFQYRPVGEFISQDVIILFIFEYSFISKIKYNFFLALLAAWLYMVLSVFQQITLARLKYPNNYKIIFCLDHHSWSSEDENIWIWWSHDFTIMSPWHVHFHLMDRLPYNLV